MKVEIECTYCGNKWEDEIYNQSSLSFTSCSKCKDKNLKFRDLSKNKIDYYQGCPPFPEKVDPWKRRYD